MAEKRMFSNRVTDTDLFLDMPATTQNLLQTTRTQAISFIT